MSCNNAKIPNVENEKIEYENIEDILYSDKGSVFKTSDYNDDTTHEYKIVDSGENYVVEMELNTDKYRVTIFNDAEVIFKDVFFGTAPQLEALDNNLVQIFKGAGSGVNFSIFIDTKRNLISPALTIKNPAFIVNDRVLGVEKIDGKVYATFTSLFDVRASVNKYELKNAENKNQVPDIEGANIYDDNNILIKYFDNDNNLLSREITIDW